MSTYSVKKEKGLEAAFPSPSTPNHGEKGQKHKERERGRERGREKERGRERERERDYFCNLILQWSTCQKYSRKIFFLSSLNFGVKFFPILEVSCFTAWKNIQNLPSPTISILVQIRIFEEGFTFYKLKDKIPLSNISFKKICFYNRLSSVLQCQLGQSLN